MIKLDLGAGHKREEGWISVDQVSRYDSPAPDVVANIAGVLPFADNYADEIRAIHVIEHFNRLDVSGILTEWMRVLKPGGTLALECPNLMACIYYIMTDPGNLRKGLLGIFGDPHYREEAMYHRWAYSAEELSHAMALAGLTDIRREVPQFHYKDRDMRLVGMKPNV